MTQLRDSARIRGILESARTIAVLGAQANAALAAHWVPDYLAAQGYRILPVNPRLAGERLWGEPVRATLRELQEPVDIVDVFRRGEHIPAHLDDILAMRPLPKVVWLQLGIKNDAAAKRLEEAGISVVQNRCAYAEHRRLGLDGRL